MPGPHTNHWHGAWLAIASGGWWTSREVWESLDNDATRQQIHESLHHMATHGFIEKRRTSPMQYAVSPACKVPQGLTVAEVLRALGVTKNEERKAA